MWHIHIHSSMMFIVLLASAFLCGETATTGLTFKLYGLQDVKIRRIRENTLGDSYRNYQFLSYNETIKPFIVNRGLGLFVNVSYANLFLQFSMDQSTFLLVSDKCVNCEHRLYNTSHSVTSYIYNYESDDCWSNLFSAENSTTSECYASFRYQGSDVFGKIGYESIYLGLGTAIITIPDIIFVTFQQGDLIPSNAQGILGFGNSDIEGNFGHSLLENLLDNDHITAPYILACVNNEGRGYLSLGADVKDYSSLLWTKQKSPFSYSFSVSELSFANLTIKRAMHGVVSFGTAYLQLSTEIFDSVHKTIVNLVCNSQGNQSQVEKLCDVVDKMLLYQMRAILQLSDLKLLQEIETPVFTLVGEKSKAVKLKISRIFGVCEDVTQNYNTEIAASLNDTSEIETCVWIVKNTDNRNDIIFGNLINSESGTLYFFDKEKGKMGFIRDFSCDEMEDFATIPAKHIFYAFMAEKIIIIVALAVIVIASLNKCDEYFYEDVDPSNEENMTSLNLTQHRNTNTQNARSEANEAHQSSPQRLDDSGFENVSSGQMG